MQEVYQLEYRRLQQNRFFTTGLIDSNLSGLFSIKFGFCNSSVSFELSFACFAVDMAMSCSWPLFGTADLLNGLLIAVIIIRDPCFSRATASPATWRISIRTHFRLLNTLLMLVSLFDLILAALMSSSVKINFALITFGEFNLNFSGIHYSVSLFHFRRIKCFPIFLSVSDGFSVSMWPQIDICSRNPRANRGDQFQESWFQAGKGWKTGLGIQNSRYCAADFVQPSKSEFELWILPWSRGVWSFWLQWLWWIRDHVDQWQWAVPESS